MMKMLGNGILLIFFSIAIFYTYAQTAVSYTGMGSIICPASPAASITPSVTGLTFSQITRGSGVTCASISNGINGSAFNVGSAALAFSGNKYYTFSVSSNASTTFVFSAITVYSRQSAGTITCDVQYSIDAGARTSIGTFIATTSATPAPYSFILGSPVSIGASQVLNIYVIPYGASVATSTISVSNGTNITASTSNDAYRSKQTGDWSAISTWEYTTDGGSTWSNATSTPEYTRGSITIQSPHTVTIASSLIGTSRVDGVIVSSSGTLLLNSNCTLQLADAAGGVDLKVLGTFIDKSTTGSGLNNGAGDGTWELGSSGTYIKEGNSSSNAWKDSYEGGIATIPATSNWVVRQTAASVFSMSSVDMYYGNLIVENTSGNVWSSTLGQKFLGSASSTAPVIKGNLDIGGTGTSAVNFVSTNTNPSTVVVKGNMTIRAGNTFSIGSSGNADSCSGLAVWGNVLVDGSLLYGTAGGDRTFFLNGNAAQTISGLGTISPYNLNISNTSGVTLGKTISLANNMTLTNSSILNLQTFTLNIPGSWTGGTSSISTVSGTGSVILNGSLQQKLSGRTNFNTLRLNNTAGAQMQSGSIIGISKALELQTGIFAVNGQSLTFYSQSVNNYGYLNNFSSGFAGTLTGNVTAQLSVPSGGVNQHFVGSPVAATLSQFGASGTSGYVTPFYVGGLCSELRNGGGPYGTVFSWEEDKALSAPGGPCPLYGWRVQTTGSAINAKGYSVYMRPGTFSISGSVNQTSPISVSGLANTGYSLGTSQNPSTSTYTSGWHLLANPYLAPYDMLGSLQASPNNTNFDDMMVWVASGRFSGTYQSLVSGAFNGNMLAPFQGVMVHRGNGGAASAPQTAASFQFNKAFQTTPATLPQFTRKLSQGALRIEIAGNGYEDVTYVEFKDNVSSNFDIGYDSRKMVSAIGQPTIYTLLNAEFMSANVNRSIEDVSTIPLNVAAGANGTFTFTFDGISSFDATSYIYLEDKVTGAYQDMRSNNAYSFTMNQADAHDRFILHFTPAVKVSSTDATCSANGTISISQPGSVSWNYTLIDNNGFSIAQGTLSQSAPVAQGVGVGLYTLTLTDTNGYEVIQTIEISGVQSIVAVFSSDSTTEVGEGSAFTCTTPTALSYLWDFGDGTTLGVLSPAISHQYQNEGVYNVSLTVTNQNGCSSTATRPITVTEKTVSGINDASTENGISMWSNGNKVFIDLRMLDNPNATVSIYNILGQQLNHERFIRSDIYATSILNAQTGNVIVLVKNEDEIVAGKLLLLK
ncbi:MAG: PKD domain-containing protein [Bacteroidota bacterium]